MRCFSNSRDKMQLLDMYVSKAIYMFVGGCLGKRVVWFKHHKGPATLMPRQ